MRKKIIIIVIIAAVIFSLGIFKDQVLKALITAGASTILGAPVHIDGFSLSLLNQSVKIKGFKIYQPKGYPKGLLLDMPVIAADYDLSALLKGKARFPSVELNLREVVIVKNEAGEFNVDLLGSIELHPDIPAESDRGEPFCVTYPEHEIAKRFGELARKIAGKISMLSFADSQ